MGLEDETKKEDNIENKKDELTIADAAAFDFIVESFNLDIPSCNSYSIYKHYSDDL